MSPSFSIMFHFTYEFFFQSQHAFDFYFRSSAIPLPLENVTYGITLVENPVKNPTPIKVSSLVVIYLNGMCVSDYESKC